jgi:hypothetical protein
VKHARTFDVLMRDLMRAMVASAMLAPNLNANVGARAGFLPRIAAEVHILAMEPQGGRNMSSTTIP